MRRTSRNIEVAWTRTRSSDADAPRETLRIRQGRGEWRELKSVDELPPEVQELVGDFFRSKASSDADARGIESLDRVVKVQDLPVVRPSRRRRHIRKTERGGSFQLDYVWFDVWSLLMYLFAVGLLIYFAVESLDSYSNSLFGKALPALLFLAAAGTAYIALATLCNRTEFTIADGRLAVRHRPFPWPGNHVLAIEEVRQLYCTVYRHGKYGLRWRVQAHTEYDGTVTLVSEVRTKSEAVSIERAIERRLGIEDWPRFGD